MTQAGTTRTVRRAGTKTTVIPGQGNPGQGKQGALQKFRLGRYGRPNKLRLTTANKELWRRG